jgi:hypothetical protein
MKRARWLVLLAGSLIVASATTVVLLAGGGSDQRYEANGTVLEAPQGGPQLCLGGIAESLPPQCSGLPIDGWDWDLVEGEESASGTRWRAVYVQGTYDGTTFTLTSPPGEFRAAPDPGYEGRFRPACEEPQAVDADAGLEEWQNAPDGGEVSETPGLVATWVTDPGNPEWDGPFVGNLIVRPGSADEATAHVRRFYAGHLCVVERDQRTAKELDADFARLEDVLTQTILYGSANHQRGVIEATIVVVDDQAKREIQDAYGAGVVELTGALKPI